MVTLGMDLSLSTSTWSALSWSANSSSVTLFDDAGQIDGSLDTRVATADDGYVLCPEERAVAVRAVGDALGAVLGLTGHVHVAPACAGGQDDGAALEHSAVLKRHRGVAAGSSAGTIWPRAAA